MIVDASFMLAGGLLLVGWLLFAHFRAQQQKVKQETERHFLEQALIQIQKKEVQLQQQYQIEHQQLLLREKEVHQLHSALTAVQEKLQHFDYWKNECKQLNQELRIQLEINSIQKAELHKVTIRLEETRIAAEEKQRLFSNNEHHLSTQFENLANRIFKHSSRHIDEKNQQSLNGLIAPLREQLDGLRRQVQESFSYESRERHILSHEIQNLQQLNAKMMQETINLTHALKGDNKIQGNWGEVILSRVLEVSGLRDGYEYDTQVNIQINSQSRMQPDVVVHLPQGKDVIIDAKMTLVAYERYFNSKDNTMRDRAIDEHIAAIRSHIRLLGHKDYQKLPGLRSLDYVLMFIPIEPAFLLAIDRQPELIGEALKYNVMLVSPTTLLVALRTINNLWRYEHQSYNAQRIADRAAKLYDKMRLFVDDMTSIGQNLSRAQKSYQQAMKKLSQGRGNLIAQSESFRHLGVEIKRNINLKLAGQVPPDDLSEDTAMEENTLD